MLYANLHVFALKEEMKRRVPIKLELPHLLKQILQRDNHLVHTRNNVSMVDLWLHLLILP